MRDDGRNDDSVRIDDDNDVIMGKGGDSDMDDDFVVEDRPKKKLKPVEKGREVEKEKEVEVVRDGKKKRDEERGQVAEKRKGVDSSKVKAIDKKKKEQESKQTAKEKRRAGKAKAVEEEESSDEEIGILDITMDDDEELGLTERGKRILKIRKNYYLGDLRIDCTKLQPTPEEAAVRDIDQKFVDTLANRIVDTPTANREKISINLTCCMYL